MLRDRVLDFLPVSIELTNCRSSNLFAKKNNKTLRQTLLHPKYSKLAQSVHAAYSDSLDRRLGDFLLELKAGNDPFYRRFLNPYGDNCYCEFRLRDANAQKFKGLYCFTEDGTLKYIGRSTDSFAKRINQGYGRIHPKHCYLDGQATNCHLNALIARSVGQIAFLVCALVNDDDIKVTEAALIATEKLTWNIQLNKYPI